MADNNDPADLGMAGNGIWLFPFPPPSLDQDRKKYPYLQAPTHLTSTEFEHINDVCRGYHTIGKLFERADKFKKSASEARAKLIEEREGQDSWKDKLTEYEKSAIRTRDPMRRQRLETLCKKIRTLLVKEKKLNVREEKLAKDKEEFALEVEETAQIQSMNHAISIVRTCVNVRSRRQEEKCLLITSGRTRRIN